MVNKKAAEYIASGQYEYAKRLLSEAVFTSIHDKERRISYDDTQQYGVHEIFIGRTFLSIALLYQYLKKRMKRVDRQDILVDPLLYELNESVKKVLTHDEFNFRFHRLAKKKLLEVESHDYQTSALEVHRLLDNRKDDNLNTKFKHIVSLVNQRDSEIINDLNNSMNLTDEDAIKEVLVNCEYFNRKIEQYAKDLSFEFKLKFGENAYEKTLPFWAQLIQAKVSDKI